MLVMLRGVLAAAVVIAVGAAWPAGAQQRLETAPLAIVTDDGRQEFTVELAIAPADQTRGLMFRRALPADAGMLFLYNTDAMRAFWMRNTFVPLDIIFVAGDGRIAHIAQRTVPFLEATISSRVPVRAVLELNAGTARRLGIEVGDVVLYDAFETGG